MVVLAIPAFILLFTRIHAYYRRVANILHLHEVPPASAGKRTRMIVPVTGVSRLTSYALSQGLSLGQDVTAVRVVLDQGDQGDADARRIEEEWARWKPGVPLRVLRTEYASVVDPIVAYIDELCLQGDEQIVVLIPTLMPSRIRYRALHNHLDLVLSAALRSHPEVVVARVTMPLPDEQARSGGPGSRARAAS